MADEKTPQAIRQARVINNDLKWVSLRARGIFPPKDQEEAQKRLKEAHGY